MDTSKSSLRPGKDSIGLCVGAVIMDNNGRILLIKRKSLIDSNKLRVGDGEWSAPGGKVDFGERVEDALKREIAEEIGLEVKIKKFLGYTEQLMDNSNLHWFLLHFLCEPVGEPTVMEPEKIDKLGWFQLDSLPENVIHEHVTRPLKMLKECSESYGNENTRKNGP